MKKIFKLNNKIMYAVVLGLILIVPAKSFAVWGVGDETNDPADIATNANTTAQATLQTIDQYFGYLKTFGLDGLAYSLAQKASQKLVSSVLNSVNGGASQNKPPNYITNYAQYFQDITGKQVSNYTNSLSSSNNPFAAGIAVGIANNNSGFSPSGINAFNLDKVLTNGSSWQSAGNNLSSAGIQGFDFYSALAYPQNTPLGTNLIAQQQLGQNLATAQNIAKIQLTSSGYKPQTLANTGQGIFASIGSQYGVNTNALISASKNANNITKVNNAVKNGNSQSGDQQFNQAVDLGNYHSPSATDQYDSNGIIVSADITADANLNDNGNPTGSGAGAETYSNANDVGADVASPASTNENNVNKSTDEARVRLQNSDQFFKLIFSTLTQMVTGLIDRGISSLTSDAGSQSKYQYGSPADAAHAKNWSATPQTIIDFRNDLYVANQKTQLDVTYNQQTLDLLKQPVTGKTLNSVQVASNTPAEQGTSDVLETLEQCIPGPDTGWETRLKQYVDAKLKETQNRGNQDGDDGDVNSKLYKIVAQEVDTALQEEQERLDNPFLNIPASSELMLIAKNYYKNTKRFQGVFSTLLLKRQIASQLNNIILQTKAFIPTLVLFDDQWNNLSKADKNSLYVSLKKAIVDDFPEKYGTVDTTGATILKDLPLDDSATPDVDEHDAEMKQRVFDEEWHVWETDTVKITEAQRQKLYQQFAAIETNITDAKSLQQTKNTMDSIAQQNTELADALHDCLAIRSAVKNYSAYPTDASWDSFKKTLYSDRIRNAFIPSASIIAVANGTGKVDFSKEGAITLPLQNLDRIVISGYSGGLGVDLNNIGDHGLYGIDMGHAGPSGYTSEYTVNKLQVQPVIPEVDGKDGSGGSLGYKVGIPSSRNLIDTLYQEDSDGTLFCRLPAFLLDYWLPKHATGEPIGCFQATAHDSSHDKDTVPNWYTTNRAEIYFNFSGQNAF